MSHEEVYHSLETNEKGLSEQETQRRLKRYGYNELESRRFGWGPVLLRQFKNPIFVILIACAIISARFATIDQATRVVLKKAPPDTKISDIMSKLLITVEPDYTMQDAARIMVDHKIGKLPVVKENKLVGLLTAADFAR